MANELITTFQLVYSKNNAVFDRTINNFAVSVTGTAATHDVQNVGTAEETLALGDVTLTGFAFFRNLDSTNYIEIGKTTGTYSIKLLPTEWAYLRLDSWANIFAKANTAAVDLEYMLLSN